jgi:hypothetical protein
VRRVHATLAHQLREALQQQHSERIARLTRQMFTSTLQGANDTV